MRIALLVCILLIFSACISGCTSAPKIPPAPKVVEIKVPYTVPCVDVMPDKPAINTDMDLLALNDYDFIQAIHTDRLKLDDYALKLETILLACKMDPAPGELWPSPPDKPAALHPAFLFPQCGTDSLAHGSTRCRSSYG
jgi:hypothetical protein